MYCLPTPFSRPPSRGADPSCIEIYCLGFWPPLSWNAKFPRPPPLAALSPRAPPLMLLAGLELAPPVGAAFLICELTCVGRKLVKMSYWSGDADSFPFFERAPLLLAPFLWAWLGSIPSPPLSLSLLAVFLIELSFFAIFLPVILGICKCSGELCFVLAASCASFCCYKNMASCS